MSTISRSAKPSMPPRPSPSLSSESIDVKGKPRFERHLAHTSSEQSVTSCSTHRLATRSVLLVQQRPSGLCGLHKAAA